MPASWSIRNYLIALVLALALPLLALLAYSLHSNYQEALTQAQNSSRHLSEMAAADTSRFIRDSRGFLEGLARRPQVQRHDAADCDPLLGDIKQLFPSFANLAVLDRSGQMVCSALAPTAAKLPSFAGMPWFHDVRAANRFLVAKPHLGPISKKWVAVVAQPLQDASGQFDGLIGYSLDLASFQPLSEHASLPMGLQVHLVDRSGLVIGGLRLAEGEMGQPYADTEALAVLDKEASALLGEGERQRLVSGAAVADTDWRVISSQPAHDVLAGLWLRANQEYLAAILLIALGSVIAFYVSRHIIRPVTRIARTAKSVAAGEFGLRASVGGPREIVAVAEQFNQMLDVRLKAEAQYRDLFESASDGIVVVNQQARIVLANGQAERIFGYGPGDMLEQPIEILLPQIHRTAHPRWFADYFKNPVRRQMGRMVQGQRKNGQLFPCDIGLSPLHVNDTLMVSAVVHDLSERTEFQEKLTHLANHDALTDLPNRTLLLDRLQQAITRAGRSASQVAVIHLDIDGFGVFNDFHGAATGDVILKLCAERLRTALRETDTIVRSGSDEFIVLIEDSLEGVAAMNFVDRLRSAFLPPMVVANHDPIRISLSCGIALFPSDGLDTGSLLKNADLALIQAKRDGGDSARFFESEMDAHASQRVALLSRLRGALERQELFLHYQPQVDISSGKIVGVEALLRWQSPELGAVPPARFIPLAEESGLIDTIGEWVLHQACAQGAQWRQAGLPPLVMAINLSARQFRHNRLISVVESALRTSGLPAQQLELEITEGMLMQNPDAAVSILNTLHHMGARISIDDFGTGYSSLSYLKRFPVHVLKIDQSFVRDVPASADDAAIVSAIVSLAHSLRLGVIAEGVETEVQRAFLAGLGCQHCQGYLFSRPVSPDAIAALLRTPQGRLPAGLPGP